MSFECFFRSLAATALVAILNSGPATAADDKSKSAEPAAATETSEKIFAPSDLAALKGMVGKRVTVGGTIVRSGENKSKTVRFLNFTPNYNESISLVFFVKRDASFTVEKLQEWVGKKVRATGVVSEYSSQTQIEIAAWSQLQEVK